MCTLTCDLPFPRRHDTHTSIPPPLAPLQGSCERFGLVMVSHVHCNVAIWHLQQEEAAAAAALPPSHPLPACRGQKSAAALHLPQFAWASPVIVVLVGAAPAAFTPAQTNLASAALLVPQILFVAATRYAMNARLVIIVRLHRRRHLSGALWAHFL